MSKVSPSYAPRVEYALAFVRFCNGYTVHPTDSADLVMLARSVKLAGAHRSDKAKLAEARQQFETKAQACGFEVTYPGDTITNLVKNGKDVPEWVPIR